MGSGRQLLMGIETRRYSVNNTENILDLNLQ